jgi:hypothetical protein
MSNLYDLGIKHNTDKSYAHYFTKIYDLYFNKIRIDNINFLELGIGSNAASGPMWAEYFCNGNIYVFDIVQNYVDKINNYCIKNLKGFCGDVTSHDILTDFLKNNCNNFDVILDDASHHVKDMQISFGKLFSSVKSGGYYIIEDLQVARISDTDHYSGCISCEKNIIEVLTEYMESGKISSPFINNSDSIYIESNIDFIKIHGDYINWDNKRIPDDIIKFSMTAIIKKL